MNYPNTLPKAVLFDLDDTLTPSSEKPSDKMIALLDQLITRVPVAIVSAASYPRIESLFLNVLTSHLTNGQLYAFANNSSEGYLFRNSQWEREYSFAFTDDERSKIKDTIKVSTAELGLSHASQHEHGLLERDSKIVFLGLDNDIPNEHKRAWDPDMSKRKALKASLDERLSDFEVHIGGTHSVDVTKKGMNKSYGVLWLSRHLNIPPQEMLFVGDAFYEGGNDAMVIPTGINTFPVEGPHQTLLLIQELLKL
jgi:HAD superfamily hydrolase (TIGR01484 family)